MSLPEHRASDADRDAVADRLRVAGGDGRLDPEELEERLAAAYGARTLGELDLLTADLPAPPEAPEKRPSVWRSERVRQRLAGFIIPNTICIAIWAATDPGGYFWPFWVLLGTGIALFSTLVHVWLGVEDEDDGEAQPLPEPPGLPRLPGSPRR